MNDKIIIGIFTAVTAVTTVIVKIILKKNKKKCVKNLKSHPVFTYLGRMQKDYTNKMLGCKITDKKRESLFYTFVYGTVCEWTILLNDALDKQLLYDGQNMLYEDVFGKWIFKFLAEKKIKMINIYGIPQEFMQMYDSTIGGKLNHCGEDAITEIIRAKGYECGIDKMYAIYTQFHYYIRVMIESVESFLQYANGHVTQVLKNWEEK